MNLHEYQAREIMSKFGIRIPTGAMAESVDEATVIAGRLGGSKWMVKAQIHAGGRDEAGGVRPADSIEEANSHANEILGKFLKTYQTGAGGKIVGKVRCDIIANGVVEATPSNDVKVYGATGQTNGSCGRHHNRRKRHGASQN